jgi:hypothetical protein
VGVALRRGAAYAGLVFTLALGAFVFYRARLAVSGSALVDAAPEPAQRTIRELAERSPPSPDDAGYVYPSFPLEALHPRPVGYGTVTCDIDPGGRDKDPDRGSVRPERAPRSSTALLIRGRLVADVPAGSGSATYRLQTGTGEFSWRDLPEGGAVACDGFTARWKTGISARIVGRPLPNAYVSGCGGVEALSGVENETVHLEVDAPLDCEVRVWVGDGDREADGPTVPVRTEVGRDTLVTVEMPGPDDFRTLSQDELEGRSAIDARIAAIHEDCRKSPDCAERLEEREREKVRVRERIAAGEVDEGD